MKSQHSRNAAPRPREIKGSARPKGEQAIGAELYEQIRAAVRELAPTTR